MQEIISGRKLKYLWDTKVIIF